MLKRSASPLRLRGFIALHEVKRLKQKRQRIKEEVFRLYNILEYKIKNNFRRINYVWD